ncbi:hypothetical protein CANCADRAFT_30747 [Tortispora caseinolytica NRRL Y-17796]|uniref:ABC transporter domain-containing protein n=1 Tax=Tortispora caseinolytica NRRL Y-17796 TaxID=767744 RepID=A0A1E4TLM2_9ASCO|nr:hypothetical protein CANCADRAFT_30747 [Tortispora caseinolytica NRRL Y-17796]
MVNCFSWKDITATVPGSPPKTILDSASGVLKGGQMLALMGPSGSGKTTLLNILAGRSAGSKIVHEGTILVDGFHCSPADFRNVSSYVEQEDTLIGSLTVQETLDYTAQLAGIETTARKEIVPELMAAFGLRDQANVLVGTPFSKSLSGGQKRRLSTASQIITSPHILFMDEPTSGLDSKASYEVISHVKSIAIKRNMIVITSLHQPSTSTFDLFDYVTFMSGGQTVFFGPTTEIDSYLSRAGYPIPHGFSSSEYTLELINKDFADSGTAVDDLTALWRQKKIQFDQALGDPPSTCKELDVGASSFEPVSKVLSPIRHSFILMRRLMKKSTRDLLAYHVRLAMYLGLAILMGTVWLRLGYDQNSIQPFTNAIFFSGAFMSFMAVAYIPSFIEDLRTFKRERANGLYGPFAFLISNFIIAVPFLFFITLIFSIVTYFMVNFRLSGSGFFTYVLWLFIDLLAAESLVVLITSLVQNFVLALALTAFANGMWMSVGGFLVPADILNVFWYYTFYWIDYQRYVFQGMMFNQFENSTYNCDSQCHCMYTSELQGQCKIAGKAVLENVGFGNRHVQQWIGILFAIIIAYRLGTYIWLRYH